MEEDKQKNDAGDPIADLIREIDDRMGRGSRITPGEWKVIRAELLGKPIDTAAIIVTSKRSGYGIESIGMGNDDRAEQMADALAHAGASLINNFGREYGPQRYDERPQWQPGKTAPKDRPILAKFGGCPRVVVWRDSDWVFHGTTALSMPPEQWMDIPE